MKAKTLFTLETPYRQPLPVKGWYFGDPDQKTLAVMGALRGNEIQQMYLCSQLIQALDTLERQGGLSRDCGILVIPCANQFSMNVGRRFWAADNTDINRMFPGYDGGETTQRIAQRIFAALSDYTYGIHVVSLYLPGDCLPHVRIMETGYHRPEEAEGFGLPYTLLRKPRPYDTTTLNYNWQIWNTQAFSLYASQTDDLDPAAAAQGVEAILRFLASKGFCPPVERAGEQTKVYHEDSLHNILSTAGGLQVHRLSLGTKVEAGDLLAHIQDPCTGAVLEQLSATVSGRIFFRHRSRLIYGHDMAFRILQE